MWTYLDSGILLIAWRGPDQAKAAARRILNDETRRFVASPVVVLETLPKAAFLGNTEEAGFLERYFSRVSKWISIDDVLVADAIEFGRLYDVANIDALHAAAAARGRVEQFITAEKPGRPLYRVTGINPTYLLDA